MRKITGLAFLGCLLMPFLAHAGSIEVCIEKYPGNERDYSALFSAGPIAIPSGTVFNRSGHAFGPPSDPSGHEHMDPGAIKAPTDLTNSEQKRRAKIMTADMNEQSKDAIAISKTVILSAHKNCATTSGNVVISDNFRWKNRAIPEADNLYYQAYGIIISGRLDTSFNGASQFDFAAQSGQLNAIVHGTLNSTVTIK